MKKTYNREVIDQLTQRLTMEFGEKSSSEIMRILREEVGGIRLTMPTLEDLHRQQRDKKIQALFTGFNHKELATRFGLHVRHVRRIVSR